MKKVFEKVNKNFGLGCMRLPMIGDKVDIEQTKKMVDLFIENGFNYFDTAHGYISTQSEVAVKECLTSRYPREAYVLTDKLTGNYFDCHEDIRPFFEKQLEICGVEYFDFYLMHAQSAPVFEHFKKCKAYETAFELKAEGKIKHVGFSFHDKAEVLDKILTEYPQIEVVQIQFNYLDFEDEIVESRKCYEVCVKHNKPVIIMEPVKGGGLINLPSEGLEEVKALNITPANLALRFAGTFENVFMVISGMSTIEQMKENISFMKEFTPLNEKEIEATKRIAHIIRTKDMIPCTACRYCVDGCPAKILIPDLFTCMNTKRQLNAWRANHLYHNVYTKEHGKAKDCIKCGKCEKICPQKLNIRELLEQVSKEFDK